MLKRILPLIAISLLGTYAADAQSVAAPVVSTGESQAELIVAPPAQQKESIFNYVEQTPRFKGDVNQYMYEHLSYPAAARKAGVQGRVYVRFVVTDNGFVKDVSMLKSSGNAELDAEAMRAVKAMNGPDGSAMWTPGMNNGQAVNCYFTLPVSFALD